MIIFERLGGWGLGNSLFQAATTLAIALDNNTSFAFPANCAFRRQRFLNSTVFEKEFPWIDMATVSGYTHWGIGDIVYVAPPRLDGNVIIDGFFQSEKYFKHRRKEVCELFRFCNDITKKAGQYSHLYTEEHCAVHVRRGDYFTAKEMRVLEKSYYEKAAMNFPINTKFVVFSDDIPWCKDNLTFLKNAIFIEEKHDALELCMMTNFKNIIVANSTFSWWGAWLGETKTVVMPNPSISWFSDEYISRRSKSANNFADLACENWKTI